MIFRGLGDLISGSILPTVLTFTVYLNSAAKPVNTETAVPENTMPSAGNVGSLLYWELEPPRISQRVIVVDGQTLHFWGGVVFVDDYGQIAIKLSTPYGGELSNCIPVSCEELLNGITVPFDSGISNQVEVEGDFTTDFEGQADGINTLIVSGKNLTTEESSATKITAEEADTVYLPNIVK